MTKRTTKAERKPAIRESASHFTNNQVLDLMKQEKQTGKQAGARNVLTYLVDRGYISMGAAITAALNGFENETDSSDNSPF